MGNFNFNRFFSDFAMKHKKPDKNKTEAIKEFGAFEQLGMDLENLAGTCDTVKDNDQQMM